MTELDGRILQVKLRPKLVKEYSLFKSKLKTQAPN